MPAPAQPVYTTIEESNAEHRLVAAQLAEVAPDLAFSAALSRVAERYVKAAAERGLHELPVPFLEALLHAEGCPDATATGAVLYSERPLLGELRKALARLGDSATPEPNLIGLSARPMKVAGDRWAWGVVLVSRRFSLAPFPVAMEAGQTTTIHLQLHGGLTEPVALLVHPDGSFSRLQPSAEVGGGFKVKASPTGGVMWIQLLATGIKGEEMLASFPVGVGSLPPGLHESFARDRGILVRHGVVR